MDYSQYINGIDIDCRDVLFKEMTIDDKTYDSLCLMNVKSDSDIEYSDTDEHDAINKMIFDAGLDFQLSSKDIFGSNECVDTKKCDILMECCGKYYCCKKCHDKKNDHACVLNVLNEKIMICKKCKKTQSFGEKCKVCKVKFSERICKKCMFLDGVYYRKSEKCKKCNRECVICLNLLTSDIKKTKCGHEFHKSCYKEIIKHNYKCPICRKSIINTKKMFKTIDRTIENSEDYNDIGLVMCNDCGKKGETAIHENGNKCLFCYSYNTYRL